jgi:hypothetical protein
MHGSSGLNLGSDQAGLETRLARSLIGMRASYVSSKGLEDELAGELHLPRLHQQRVRAAGVCAEVGTRPVGL